MRKLLPSGLLALLSAPALAQDFPLTIDTSFGQTVIETAPVRVATVDYGGADNVLALGFQPLTVREWFGPYANQIWPWAQVLSTEDPVLLSGDLDFESIAATDPDVILALRSGITAEDYAKLSAIAPVVAVPPGRGDYDLTWQEQAELAGLALGKSAEAAAGIATVEQAIADAAAAHPEWAGKTIVLMTYYNGSVGVYSASDSSVGFFKSLGLTVHPKVVEMSPEGEFYFEISQEVLPEFDADVVLWYAEPDSPEIEALASRAGMRAVAEGREIFLGQNSQVNGAMTYGSLLSLVAAVEGIVPMIEASIDGDPATAVAY